MPGYSPDVLDDLRQGSDIVDVVSQYVQLRRSGGNYMGLCPFHNERSPSFSVSAHKQLFHCFGCGAGGNVYGFIMKIENLGFVDAVKFLADRIHYVLPELDSRSIASVEEKNKIYDIYKSAARFYYDALQEQQGRGATAYLDSRRVAPGARKKFGLGYSPGGSALRDFLNKQGHDDKLLERAGLVLEGKGGRGFYDRFRGRLMFPIFDVSGKVIGFGGRILDDGEPKYLNSPETPVFDKSRTLYGLNYARLAKTDSMILVEGYMDVIALHQYGVQNAVAALGTAFTAGHARILKRYCKQVIILFDGDNAGIRATLRAIPHLYQAGLVAKVAVLHDAKDPDEYIGRFGPKAFLAQMEQAVDFVEFQVEHARAKYDLEITAQSVAFLKEAAEIIGKLGTSIEQEAYMRDLAAKYQIDQGAVKEEIARRKSDEPDFGAMQKAPPAFAGSGKAVKNAAAQVLHAMATDQVLYEKILPHLDATELGEALFVNIYHAIAASRARGKEVLPADIITALESPDDQQQAAAMLAFSAEYDSLQSQYVALAQQIRLIKENYIETQMATSTDVLVLNDLIKAKKALESTAIVL